MSALNFANGMAALLTTDAVFQAELFALLGVEVTRVLKSARDWKTVPTDQWPCILLEQGDGFAGSLLQDGSDNDGQTIGRTRAGYNSELDIALLWSEPDRERAFDQRAELPRLFAQLMLRNAQPGGIADALLQTWQSDQGLNHPKQIWVATLRGAYPIHRS